MSAGGRPLEPLVFSTSSSRFNPLFSCVKHDECYARQLGQGHCDTEFDVCINGINTRLNASISCRFYSATASFMIKAVGEPSYRESVNYTEPLELVRHLPSDVSIPYRSVYEDCPLANATLSSCALKFNVCAGPATSTDGCRADLCECMRDACKMDNVMTCNERVEFVCQLPVQAEERSSWWCPEFQLSVWLLYVMAILVLVVSCRYGCLWWKGRREGSYTLTV